MPNTPIFDDFDVWCQQVKSITKHPAFQQMLAEIRSLPSDQALSVAFTQLTPDVLRAQDVPIPEGTMISIRASQDAITPLTGNKPLLQIRAMICLPFVPQWYDFLVFPSDEAKVHPLTW